MGKHVNMEEVSRPERFVPRTGVNGTSHEFRSSHDDCA